MSNNQEIIEARLAAYVDSDLDAQERAEIEAHLAQHPQHRRLLDELRKGREFLRGLPREAAPPELVEAFNGQLERSVLLDGAGEFEEPRMRVGRWPQIFAAAAIFFLTVGLAGVVYFALPNHRAYQVATNAGAPKPPAPAPSVVPGKPGDGGVPDDGELSKDKSANPDTIAQSKSDSADNTARDTLGKNGFNYQSKNGTVADGISGQHDELTALAENVSQVRQVQELLSGNAISGALGRPENTLASSDEALVLAVRSNDPGQTEKELAGYLDPNKISWQRAPEQVPASLNSTLAMQSGNSIGEALVQEPNSAYGTSPDAYRRQGPYARKDEAAAQAKQNDPSNSRGAGGGAGQAASGEDRKFAGAASSQSKTGTAEQGVMAKSLARENSQSAATPPSPGQSPAHGIDEAKAPAATDSQVAQVQQPAPVAGQTQQRGQSAFAVQQQGGQAAQQVATAESSPIDNLYVVRRMSRRQAQELTDRLSRNGEVRGANVVRRSGGGNNYALVNNSASANNSVVANDSSQLNDNTARAIPDPADVTMRAGATTREAAGHLREQAQKPASAVPAGAEGSTAREKISELDAAGKVAKGREEKPLASAANGPDNRATDDVVKKGDSLTLRYRQPAAGAKEAREESETVTVKEDGTIAPKGVAVPKASTVVAAGRTIGELEKSLQKYEAGATTQPAVAVAINKRDISVERLSHTASDAPAPPAAPAAAPGAGGSARADKSTANSPATPPAALAATEPSEAGGRRPAPAGLPATEPANVTAAIAPPATQPAAAADDQVDVVIVVQKETAAADPAPAGVINPAPPAGNNLRQPPAATQPAGQTPAPAK